MANFEGQTELFWRNLELFLTRNTWYYLLKLVGNRILLRLRILLLILKNTKNLLNYCQVTAIGLRTEYDPKTQTNDPNDVVPGAIFSPSATKLTL